MGLAPLMSGMEVDGSYGGGGYSHHRSTHGGGPTGRSGRTNSPSSSSNASYNVPPVNNNSFGLAMPGIKMVGTYRYGTYITTYGAELAPELV